MITRNIYITVNVNLSINNMIMHNGSMTAKRQLIDNGSGARPQIPVELRRNRRGCRAGAKVKERRRKFKPALPSVIMGNVRSP